jgi:hypothetical protein
VIHKNLLLLNIVHYLLIIALNLGVRKVDVGDFDVHLVPLENKVGGSPV